ncbi:RNA polymerase-binding protein DksA [Methylibium sp.]|uniref:RNA polymerase-binding protein DksA n=1 Tax=Methylibium sp. TaxID=2067992 RepID=UPI0025E779B2|nr:RNA polymerase-binding protein DksA [Methylibium sp.]
MSKTPAKAAPGSAAAKKATANTAPPAKTAIKMAPPQSAAPKAAVAKSAPKPSAKTAAPSAKSAAPVAANPPPKPAAHAAPNKAAAKTTALAAAPAVKPTPLKTSSKATKAARLSAAAAAEPTPRNIPLPPPSRPPASNVVDLPRPARKIDPKLANVWKTKAGRELTEDELQAMPDSEYMNDKQLDFFRGQLEKQRNDLLDNAGETTEHLREDTSIVPDPADRATIEEEHALELRTRDRERKLLKKISQSLQRIESGEYGFCDETGEPIGLGRLLARPTATLSLEAQQRREMKQKMFGD